MLTMKGSRQARAPLGKIPVVIGGAGRRTMELVADHADWWNIHIGILDRLPPIRGPAGAPPGGGHGAGGGGATRGAAARPGSPPPAAASAPGRERAQRRNWSTTSRLWPNGASS